MWAILRKTRELPYHLYNLVNVIILYEIIPFISTSNKRLRPTNGCQKIDKGKITCWQIKDGLMIGRTHSSSHSVEHIAVETLRETQQVLSQRLYQDMVRTLQCSQSDSPLLISCWPQLESHKRHMHQSRQTPDQRQIQQAKTWVFQHDERRHPGGVLISGCVWYDKVWMTPGVRHSQILHCYSLTSNWTSGSFTRVAVVEGGLAR